MHDLILEKEQNRLLYELPDIGQFSLGIVKEGLLIRVASEDARNRVEALAKDIGLRCTLSVELLPAPPISPS